MSEEQKVKFFDNKLSNNKSLLNSMIKNSYYKEYINEKNYDDYDLIIEKKNYLYKKALSISYLIDYSKYYEFIQINEKLIDLTNKKLNDKEIYIHKLFLIWSIDKDFYANYMKHKYSI